MKQLFFLIILMINIIAANLDYESFSLIKSTGEYKDLDRIIFKHQYKAQNEATIYLLARYHAVTRSNFQGAYNLLRAIKNPDPYSLNLMAFCLEKIDQNSKSNIENLYSQSYLKSNQNFEAPLINKIIYLYKNSYFKKAKIEILNGNQKFPKSHTLKILEAVILYNTDYPYRAEQALGESALYENNNFDNADYYYLFALIHETHHRYIQSLAYYKYGFTLNPSFQPFQNKITYLQKIINNNFQKNINPYSFSRDEIKKYKLYQTSDNESFLTDNMIRQRLKIIKKLAETENYKLVHFEANALYKQNSGMFRKDILYYMAFSAYKLGELQEAYSNVNSSLKIKNINDIKNIDIQELGNYIDKKILEEKQKNLTIEKYKLDYPISEQLKYFIEKIPYNKRFPITKEQKKYFGLTGLSDREVINLQTILPINETKKVIKVTLFKKQPLKSKKIYKNGILSCIKFYSYKHGKVIRVETISASNKTVQTVTNIRSIKGKSIINLEKDKITFADYNFNGLPVKETTVDRNNIIIQYYNKDNEIYIKNFISGNHASHKHYNNNKLIMEEMTYYRDLLPIKKESFSPNGVLLKTTLYKYKNNLLEKESCYNSQNQLMEETVFNWYKKNINEF